MDFPPSSLLVACCHAAWFSAEWYQARHSVDATNARTYISRHKVGQVGSINRRRGEFAKDSPDLKGRVRVAMSITTESAMERLAIRQVDRPLSRTEIMRSRGRRSAGSRRTPTGRRFPRLRNTVVACMSGTVVLAGAMYLVAPSSVAWAITVKHGQYGHRQSEVLYGKATDEEGHGLQDVCIKLYGKWEHNDDPLAFVCSGGDGTFRQRVSLPHGEYLLSVTGGHDHKHLYDQVRSTKDVYLDPGNAYDISVHMKRFGLFFFLPIFSY